MKKLNLLLLFLMAAAQSPGQYSQADCCSSAATLSQFDFWLRQTETASTQPVPASQFLGESISVARLRHKPPRRARSAFMRGLKFDDRGSFAEAAGEFAKAAASDPEFSEAHGNLGVEYTATGRLDEAISEFHRALTLDPATSFHHSNLAFALIRLGRDKEAEGEAEAALAIDPTSGVAHLLLGAVLAQRPEKRRLAESHLSVAAQTFPAAHLVLSRLYSVEGASEIAAAELKRFRQVGSLVQKKQASHNQLSLCRN